MHTYSDDEIKKIVKGIIAVENHRKKKFQSGTTEERQHCVEDLTIALLELGFPSIDKFYEEVNRASILELQRCWKNVGRYSGKDDEICDMCVGREPRGCTVDHRNNEYSEMLDKCVQKRIADDYKCKYPPGVTEEDDFYLKKQMEKHKELGKSGIPGPSVMDALYKWNGDEHSSPRCSIILVKIEEPRFDIFWALRGYIA